jgi:hypothetical protein
MAGRSGSVDRRDIFDKETWRKALVVAAGAAYGDWKPLRRRFSWEESAAESPHNRKVGGRKLDRQWERWLDSAEKAVWGRGEHTTEQACVEHVGETQLGRCIKKSRKTCMGKKALEGWSAEE